MKLCEFFKKQTGIEAPINMPIDSIYMTDICNCFGCSEHCSSCWNHQVKDDSFSDFKLWDDYLDKMANFKIETITDDDSYFENCYEQRI